MTHEIFISYSRHDKDKVFPFVEQINKALGVECWIDLEGIESGEQFESVIIRAIDRCKVVLFILSEHSLDSKWTKREVHYAEHQNKRIIPVVIDGMGLRGWFIFHFGTVDYIDIHSREQCDKLLADLRGWISAPKSSQPNFYKLDNKKNSNCRFPQNLFSEDFHPIINMGIALKQFLELFPDGMYAQEARIRLNNYLSSVSKEEVIVHDDDSCSSKFDVSYINSDGAIEGAIDMDCLPNEIQDVMIVQVYLHLYEETERVKSLAQESDRNAERRDYIPLQCKLRKGDKVDVQLNIYSETLLMSDMKSVVWQGSFTKCSFDYFVPKDIDVDELSCVALLSVNGVPVGEMRFITQIVDAPRQLNPEIIAHKYSKVFISYSHLDESKVKFLHEGLELGAVPHFFDRDYLTIGDVFPQVIQDYINSADLFILCWSENASKSKYVQNERLLALERAFPQVQPEKAAKLRIYPMSIEPRAELPGDMKNYYHFGEI